MLHVNPLRRTGFTWNIKHYFIRKTMKKYSRLSSAAVVIGGLRVKKFHEKIPMVLPAYNLTNSYLGTLSSSSVALIASNSCRINCCFSAIVRKLSGSSPPLKFSISLFVNSLWMPSLYSFITEVISAASRSRSVVAPTNRTVSCNMYVYHEISRF